MTPTGDIYMVEINSVPGMSGGSIVPKQIAAAGLNMTEVINAVIEDTLCRR
jgi:D-alanine-D-alanine ligase